MKIDTNIFRGAVGEASILPNEPMKRHTTYKIGGPCDVMLVPESVEQLLELIDICNKNGIPFYVMGNGSNLLVKDGGIRGAVIKVSNKMSDISIDASTVKAQAGALLGTIVRKAYENSLSGLEFAAGIPGSFGGAVTMNAGAYGGDMKQIVKRILVCDRSGNCFTIEKDELMFGYRQSVIRQKDLIILSGEMELSEADRTDVKEKMDVLAAKRKAMQPLSQPSCGSVFKRPEGHFIGKLIEDAGLKGTAVGGAEVSQLHANFIVNVNNATARDVLELIEVVKERVKDTFGINIETEVIVIGED